METMVYLLRERADEARIDRQPRQGATLIGQTLCETTKGVLHRRTRRNSTNLD
jgi:hypothetical protein